MLRDALASARVTVGPVNTTDTDITFKPGHAEVKNGIVEIGLGPGRKLYLGRVMWSMEK